MDADDRLRLDYDQTTQSLRTLGEIRFKLLAFVPTISGAAVGLVGRPRPAAELFGVGLLGLVATLGIFVYEQRNSQIISTTARRARELERRIGFEPTAGGQEPGGHLSESPGVTETIFGRLSVSHSQGLALVYAAALAGWAYLVAWGALAAIDVPRARWLGGFAGVTAGALVFLQVARSRRSAEP